MTSCAGLAVYSLKHKSFSDKGEELRDLKNMEKTFNDLETKTRITRFSRNPSAFRYDTKSGLTRLTASKMNKSSRGGSKSVKMKALDQISCVSDLSKFKATNVEQEDTKKNNKKKTLTKKSLKAFEKTPQGKFWTMVPN